MRQCQWLLGEVLLSGRAGPEETERGCAQGEISDCRLLHPPIHTLTHHHCNHTRVAKLAELAARSLCVCCGVWTSTLRARFITTIVVAPGVVDNVFITPKAPALADSLTTPSP